MPLSKTRKGVTAGRSKPQEADPKRARIRRTLRQRAAMMHAMLGDIGRNPVYANTTTALRGGHWDKAWAKSAKAWLDANQKRFAVA